MKFIVDMCGSSSEVDGYDIAIIDITDNLLSTYSSRDDKISVLRGIFEDLSVCIFDDVAATVYPWSVLGEYAEEMRDALQHSSFLVIDDESVFDLTQSKPVSCAELWMSPDWVNDKRIASWLTWHFTVGEDDTEKEIHTTSVFIDNIKRELGWSQEESFQDMVNGWIPSDDNKQEVALKRDIVIPAGTRLCAGPRLITYYSPHYDGHIDVGTDHLLGLCVGDDDVENCPDLFEYAAKEQNNE